MKARLQNLQKILYEKKSAFLITDPYNILYLTGFIGLSPEERESALLVKQKDIFLFIPRMYEEQARNILHQRRSHSGNPDLSGASRISNKRSWASPPSRRASQDDIKVQIIIVHERHELLSRFADYLSPADMLLFEGNNLRVSEFNELKKLHGKLQDAGALIESMRQVKDEEEIKKIAQAVKITDATYEELIKYLSHTDYTKLTELDVADKIIKISRAQRGEGLGFESIVACGPASSFPHHHTSNRKLSTSNLLLIDMGIKYQGYTGDLTRCVYLGKAPAEIKKMYEIVLEANRNAINKCRAGVSCESLYSVAHDTFSKRKLETCFIHGLGHGVGLEIHEYPHVRKGIKDLLKQNMAVTIEPGLYFPNKYGIRIEDFVIVKEAGCRVLSQAASPHLIEI